MATANSNPMAVSNLMAIANSNPMATAASNPMEQQPPRLLRDFFKNGPTRHDENIARSMDNSVSPTLSRFTLEGDEFCDSMEVETAPVLPTNNFVNSHRGDDYDPENPAELAMNSEEVEVGLFDIDKAFRERKTHLIQMTMARPGADQIRSKNIVVYNILQLVEEGCMVNAVENRGIGLQDMMSATNQSVETCLAWRRGALSPFLKQVVNGDQSVEVHARVCVTKRDREDEVYTKKVFLKNRVSGWNVLNWGPFKTKLQIYDGGNRVKALMLFKEGRVTIDSYNEDNRLIDQVFY